MPTVTGVSAADETPGPDGRGPCRATRRPRVASATGSSAAPPRSPASSSSCIVTLIAVFLVVQAVPALMNNSANFFTSRVWAPGGDQPAFGILEFLWTTVAASTIAMLLAVPVGVGVALFLTQYAPALAASPGRGPRRPARRRALDRLRPLGPDHLLPVLEAGPDVDRGHARLVPALRPHGHLAAARSSSSASSSRSWSCRSSPRSRARSSTRRPTAHKEGALALGATHWEMIRTAVLPFGRPGVISASMLALGRALGETIAVTFLVSALADGTAVDLVALQRRRDLRLEDRQQRGRVQQPEQDRRLHRGRPRPLRADLRRQQHRPRRHRAQEGLHRMSTTTTAPRPRRRTAPTTRRRRPAAAPGATP